MDDIFRSALQKDALKPLQLTAAPVCVRAGTRKGTIALRYVLVSASEQVRAEQHPDSLTVVPRAVGRVMRDALAQASQSGDGLGLQLEHVELLLLTDVNADLPNQH